MTTTRWSWARLDDTELDLVRETERALGADFVLVYSPGGEGMPAKGVPGIRASELDERQLARLQGLEQRLGNVAVAYERAG